MKQMPKQAGQGRNSLTSRCSPSGSAWLTPLRQQDLTLRKSGRGDGHFLSGAERNIKAAERRLRNAPPITPGKKGTTSRQSFRSPGASCALLRGLQMVEKGDRQVGERVELPDRLEGPPALRGPHFGRGAAARPHGPVRHAAQRRFFGVSRAKKARRNTSGGHKGPWSYLRGRRRRGPGLLLHFAQRILDALHCKPVQ